MFVFPFENAWSPLGEYLDDYSLSALILGKPCYRGIRDGTRLSALGS
jgi:hypothetical protein